MPGRITIPRKLAALGAATATIAALIAAGPASAAQHDPVETRASDLLVGTWAVQGGVVEVIEERWEGYSNYTGRVTVAFTSGCPIAVGEAIWRIKDDPSGTPPTSWGMTMWSRAGAQPPGCGSESGVARFLMPSMDVLQVRLRDAIEGPYSDTYEATRLSGGPGAEDGDASTADTSPPVVKAIGSRVPMAEHSRPTLKYRVTDDSGKARVHVTLYSDGTPVIRGDTKVMQTATAKKVYTARSKVDPTYLKVPYFGPFYFCVWAEDAAGNKSEGWPNSSCAWRPIEVSLTELLTADKVNGCGPNYGWFTTGIFNMFLDSREWGDIPVEFRPACNAHDAGYWGYAFENPVTGQSIDTRPMTRNAVDQAFLANLNTICAASLNGHPDLITSCQTDPTFGATHYYAKVDEGGRGGFDSDATMKDTQHEMPASTNPPNGGRNPGPPR